MTFDLFRLLIYLDYPLFLAPASFLPVLKIYFRNYMNIEILALCYEDVLKMDLDLNLHSKKVRLFLLSV